MELEKTVERLATELVTLLQDLLTANERALGLARARQEAMRVYDVAVLTGLIEREEIDGRAMETLEKRRRELLVRFRQVLGFEPTTSQVAARVNEPLKSQLLGLAGQVRAVLEQIERINRVNAKVSEAVIKSLSKILKIVTGVAQHAGMYMRNGRKAAMAGIHLLELTA